MLRHPAPDTTSAVAELPARVARGSSRRRNGAEVLVLAENEDGSARVVPQRWTAEMGYAEMGTTRSLATLSCQPWRSGSHSIHSQPR